MEAIVKYYLLCSLLMPERKHMITDAKKDIHKILNAVERSKFMIEIDGILTPKEYVTGGADRDNVITII